MGGRIYDEPKSTGIELELMENATDLELGAWCLVHFYGTRILWFYELNPIRVPPHSNFLLSISRATDESFRSFRFSCAIGAIGALLNIVLQPRPLVVLGLNVWMGTAAGADELVKVPSQIILFQDQGAPPSSYRRVLITKGAK